MGMYDFNVLHSRIGVNSAKWEEALQAGAPADIVPLTVADMEFASAPIVVQALREVAECGLWGYTYASDSFKDSILRWMKKRHGWEGEREWMVHTSGLVQALYVAVRALTAPGDGVLVQPPVYPPFFNAVLQNRRNVVENPLKMVDGRYEMDFEDLDKKLAGANMMIFCNPHNPVGRVWSPEDVQRVVELCNKHGVPLFSDEIHADVTMPGHTHFSVGRLPREQLSACLIGTSASKTFSLAGLGCSTVFAPGFDVREKMEERLKRDGYGFNTTFGTVATQTAYNGGADWLAEMLAYVAENHEFMRQVLHQELPCLTLYPMEGTYLAWVDFSGFRMGSEELDGFLHEEAKLYINDGRMFGTGGTGFGRLNLACPRKVLHDALNRLVDAAKKRGITGK